jgi:RNA polymerase sigma-70 factor, ECF subfamily
MRTRASRARGECLCAAPDRYVLQEAYLSAFGNLTKFRADASLAKWLTRIVMNKAIRHLRPKSIMVPSDPAENVKWLDAEVIAMPNLASELDPERAAARSQVRDLLERRDR